MQLCTEKLLVLLIASLIINDDNFGMLSQVFGSI